MKAFNITRETNRRLTSVVNGEINIVLGEDAATNLHASLHMANLFRTSRRFEHIVYINLPFSRNRFTQERKKVEGARLNEDKMKILHLSGGRVAESVWGIEGSLKDPSRTAIIINSWELSSSSYRLREVLIFALHALQLELGVTIIVFAMSNPAKVQSRRLNKAGLGKLALAAESIITYQEAAEEEKNEVKNQEEVLMLHEYKEVVDEVSGDDSKEVQEVIQAAEETSVGVNLSVSKNNNLPDAVRHLNRRERRRMERMATIGRV